MPKVHQSHRRAESNDQGARLSRRKFLRKLAAVSITALAGSSVLEGCTPPPATPTTAPTSPPVAKVSTASETGPMSLMEALKNRKSVSGFQSQPVPKEKLVELLWAAWGINRPDSGKRTAPSAMNAQEIDLYVLAAEGAFVYDAKANQMTLVVDQDLRARAVSSASLKDAAVQLVFVADYAKLKTSPQSQKEVWSGAHCGFIGQNVYLYCTSAGLSAHFYAGIDKVALRAPLKLRDDQAIVFGQAVGYAKT